ncbi:helix-turn-helix transcriptional regulator, partial [Dysosmobacter welbionis]
RGAMARNGALLPSITPAAWAVSGPQSSSPRSCGRSIHCPTRSLPAPPLHWERSASPGFPLYCWRSAT